MDGFYRGIETSLLAVSLLLGLGAVILSSGSLGRQPTARMAGTQLAVTLPMLSVTASR
ncbi:hypothetical protein [Methylobacterium sp. BTF04]|uniref:hypothetical protein n=1 Tax=Methylobacterium sp. BTF04 TaxID=2708300 RepID=UPI0019533153|nr:hypothetical protein [Methylobacterium sp. BTF04]